MRICIHMYIYIYMHYTDDISIINDDDNSMFRHLRREPRRAGVPDLLDSNVMIMGYI